MTDGQYELKVEVSGGKVKATLNTDVAKDAARGEETIAENSLRLDAVRLLQQWLGRWQLISEMGEQNREFPVLDTFRVLGELLYQIVFPGSVGNGFLQSHGDAQRAGQPLRVLLSFAEDSVELAALPWEFLHFRGDSQKAGFYLATQTDLVLNRFLPRVRREMPAADLPLKVLFIMCIPEGDEPGELEQRGEILASIGRLRRRTGQLDVQVVQNWKVSDVEVQLDKDPHVVHIVGHAHHVWDAGRMRGAIQLPGPDGRLQWNDPQPVIELLTRGKSPEQLPRMVVLHLCETKPVDFTASFERLAPDLIKVGIPAVLAMQYPISAKAARRFTSNFYDRLANGDEIDVVVQDTRFDMSNSLNDNRMIGTPVLYMQSLRGRLVRQEAELPSEGKVDPHQVSTRSTVVDGSGTRQRLIQAAWTEATNPESILALQRWIEASDWSDDAAENERRIRQHMKFEDPDLADHGPMYLAMIQSLSGGQG